MSHQVTPSTNLFDRVGIPKTLTWGYLGILIFMIGDGLEIAWLSPYLLEKGLSIAQSASLFTAYGVTIAISSWFSGVLTESYGPKKTMFLGLIMYILGTVCFVGFALPTLNLTTMVFSYAIRGFAYPLFAYSFLVWISYRAPAKMLSRAAGWFWFVFTGGLNVFGAYYSSWAIKHLGETQDIRYMNTLWSSIFWVLLGAFFALVLNKDKYQTSTQKEDSSKLAALKKGITIMKDEPKVLLCGIIRVINTTSQFALPIFMPTYMALHNVSTVNWLQMWGTIFTVNIIFNLIFGFVGDTFGWRKTVQWFGAISCAISTLLFYYSPILFDSNYWLILFCGCLWGASLAGFVPLSALTPSLVKKDKGAAMAILNLGAGLAVFTGPIIVGLFYSMVGATGVIWILSGLYVLAAILTRFIKLPGDAKTAQFVVE